MRRIAVVPSVVAALVLLVCAANALQVRSKQPMVFIHTVETKETAQGQHSTLLDVGAAGAEVHAKPAHAAAAAHHAKQTQHGDETAAFLSVGAARGEDETDRQDDGDKKRGSEDETAETSQGQGNADAEREESNDEANEQRNSVKAVEKAVFGNNAAADGNGAPGGDSTGNTGNTGGGGNSNGNTGGAAAPGSAITNQMERFTGPPVVISPSCKWCRALIREAFTRDRNGQIATPCTEHIEEVQPMCAVFMRENSVRLNYGLDPSHICVDINACTVSEAHEDARLTSGFGPGGEREEDEPLKHEFGEFSMDSSDETFKFMEDGFGDRNADARIEFKRAFRRPPFVHMSITGFDISAKSDIRIQVKATEIDRYGFVFNALTWDTTSIRNIRIEWFAYSRSYAPRGQIRSGRVRADNPKEYVHQVTFPAPFVNNPFVAMALTGIDAVAGSDVRVELGEVNPRTTDFEALIKSPGDSSNRWVAMSWLAFDVRTLPIVSGSVTFDRGTGDFLRFWSPPLGDREVIKKIDFAAMPELNLPDFEEAPDIFLSLEGMDLDRGTAPRLRLDVRNATPLGFELVVKTWENTKINGLTIRYFAIKRTGA